MLKLSLAISFAILAFPVVVYAADTSNDNGSQTDAKSSSAATPKTSHASPGTTGAMKDAEGGSFTATQADQNKILPNATTH